MAKTDSSFSPDQYATVADRLELFYARFPEGRVNTELVGRRDGEITFKALVYRSASETLAAATGWASERESDGTWEEYWYDALWRRVLTRARRDPSSIYDAMVSGPLCMGGIQCRSFTERVWRDGDQALIDCYC